MILLTEGIECRKPLFDIGVTVENHHLWCSRVAIIARHRCGRIIGLTGFTRARIDEPRVRFSSKLGDQILVQRLCFFGTDDPRLHGRDSGKDSDLALRLTCCACRRARVDR